jgi:hypothetical protein
MSHKTNRTLSLSFCQVNNLVRKCHLVDGEWVAAISNRF